MLKIDSLSFYNQIKRVLVMQVCLSRSQTETFFTCFYVQFYILTSASNSTSGYLFLKKYLIFLVVLVILCTSIKHFVVHNCRFFSHI
jgi:hypothetical protein